MVIKSADDLSQALGKYEPDYGYEVYVHRGVAYSRFAWPEFIAAIEDFPLHDDDVMLVGPPKSGTNWLDIMVAHLYDHWGTTKISRNGIVPEICLPNIERLGFDGYGTCLRAESPRLMKSHLPSDHMPLAFRDHGVGRAVVITRNPKDVCDSYFNQLKPALTLDWDQFVPAFAAGKTPFGPWLHNVLSWREPKYADRVLHLTYEEMRRDIRAELKRLTDFLGPVSPERLEKVIADTEFEAMKTNGLSKEYQSMMVIRSAQVGGWKRRFTVAQSEYFDEVLDKPLRERGIEMIYEL